MRIAALVAFLVVSPAAAAPDPAALAAYDRGDYLGAVGLAERAGGAENLAFAAKSLNAVSYFDRDRKTTRERCNRAMDYAEAAISADPAFAEAHFNLGVAMLIKASNMGAARAFLSNLPARGRRKFDDALALDPDFAPFLIASAAWRIEVANRGGGFFMGPTPLRATMKFCAPAPLIPSTTSSPMNAPSACSPTGATSGAPRRSLVSKTR